VTKPLTQPLRNLSAALISLECICIGSMLKYMPQKEAKAFGKALCTMDFLLSLEEMTRRIHFFPAITKKRMMENVPHVERMTEELGFQYNKAMGLKPIPGIRLDNVVAVDPNNLFNFNAPHAQG